MSLATALMTQIIQQLGRLLLFVFDWGACRYNRDCTEDEL